MTLDQYFDAICPGKKVVVIINSIESKVHFCMNRPVLQKITIIGSVTCTRAGFGEIIDLIASGMMKSEKYVTDILTLNNLQKTMEKQIDSNDPLIKSIMKFN